MKMVGKFLEKIFDIKIFKFLFFISCFLYCIPFTNNLFSKIFKIFIFWGFLTFLINYFFNKKYTLKRVDFLLFIFLAISFVGCLVNFKANLIQNVIAVVYLFIQTITILSYNCEKSLNEKIKEIRLFSMVAIILTFICAVASILIFLLNFKYSYADGFQQYLFGVFEGRLWGIYGNPNTLGQFCLVSIWLSILMLIINFNSTKIKSINIFLFLNIFFQLVCCSLSNSRSTLLGVLISLIVFSVFYNALKLKKDKIHVWETMLRNKLLIFSKVAIIVIVVFLILIGTKQIMVFCSKAFKNIDNNYINQNEKVDVSGNIQNENGDISDNIQNDSDELLNININNDESVEVDREYKNADFSNGRFELWNGGLKVFANNILFGVGVKNINDTVNKYLSSETVLVAPKLSSNMHNIFIQVLVAHGILAFIVFVSYLLYYVLKILNFLFTFNDNRKDKVFIFNMILVYFSMLCSLLVINLFDSNILYFCAIFLAFIFWNTISNINCLLDLYNKEYGKKKILFLIDSLETGGAEKALVDLTNNLNCNKYELYVKTIYNEGKYINDLNKKVNYSYVIKKPTIWKKQIFYRLVKYLPPKFLYQLIIAENFDVEIAFHELLSTKIISGSSNNSYKVAWIHTNMFLTDKPYQMFNNYIAFVNGYDSFDKIVCVSDNIRHIFDNKTKLNQKTITIYNPIDKRRIVSLANKKCDLKKTKDKFLIVSIGRLEKVKGYDRLLNVIKEIKDVHENIELWILGSGSEYDSLQEYISNHDLVDIVKLLGFKDNPYNYLKQADLFISTSLVEGFSLVVAEAITLGVPVLSTNTDGPVEILASGEYGILTDNDEESIKRSLLEIINNRNKIKELQKKSIVRSKDFELVDTIEKFDILMNFDIIKKSQNDVFCTVFTPSYNRAYILPKLYESLKRQTNKDFEWIVVDDGSVDETEELFKKWCKEKNKFNIIYKKVENGGKQKAVNKGLELANGKMFFIVDSDDFLTDRAIEFVKKYEQSINSLEGFAGVAGLRGYTNGKIIGEANQNEFIDCTNLERLENNLWGDKAEAYYTDLFRKYKFPEVLNEKFITECVVWDKIAYDGYKLRWFKEILTNGEYLEDGLTKDGMSLYYKSPVGYLIFIRNEMKYHPYDIKRKMGHYYRYYLINKDNKNIKEIADDLLTNQFFLKGVILLYKILKKQGA